ncbi:TetR family transcriptional regulator C-terminal domain-containing protein [Nocardioides sp. TF02-7]|uniref:TetR/AcrR family transcriptional regulator n=1 Tax=Nocardioides sp. TF02-7 TaxID=2917724 RepID=UPI001F052ABC|nr:TetR family transcriptional regulator C-terminal domain-containing protein [Nocardioides sp. TF02-7]UMG93988.1 TetR family transcriptional regulator C-terminal domain-containing protein [Nocardioides sp. TF02-7]
MPKIVDRNERRRELAEAVWRVIRQDGVEQASVRNVAREAGLSAGSLRHIFSTQSELLQFAMRTVIDRVETRVAGIAVPDEPRAAAQVVLEQLLPLDEERRAENEVWVAFSARAMVDDHLRAVRDDAYDRLRGAAEHWIRLLTDLGPEEQDVESERLFSLIDGLALHAALRPDAATPERLKAVLAHHLDQLTQGGRR